MVCLDILYGDVQQKVELTRGMETLQNFRKQVRLGLKAGKAILTVIGQLDLRKYKLTAANGGGFQYSHILFYHASLMRSKTGLAVLWTISPISLLVSLQFSCSKLIIFRSVSSSVYFIKDVYIGLGLQKSDF